MFYYKLVKMIRFRRNVKFWLKNCTLAFILMSAMYCFLSWKLRDETSSSLEEPIVKDERKSQFGEGNANYDNKLYQNSKSDVEVADGETKDYHNYTLMAIEAKQTGPGEQGLAYHLSSSLTKERDKLFRVNGFNARASDDISLHRSIPDIRHKKCREFTYLSVLPTVSIVVPFHNEHFTTLLRTAVSAIYRSPPHLLIEIILVDDGSTKEFLKTQLDDYLAANLSIVHVLRLEKRAGLIQARLEGAKIAKGDVIVFLDSHTECNTNWLPPLLEPIQRSYRTVVCPFIDVIDFETFEYRAQDEGARGAFDWELYYKRLPLTQQDKDNMPHPFKSPVMAGGLFAISKRFFWELGGYDPGLQIWGGEQYELSFKVWQCGGVMLDAPCSRVGHVYRKYAPFPNPGVGDYLGKNYKRVAEVWMDEYAEFIYKRKPHYRHIDPGLLTEQKALRDRLNCKPFKWFMREVAFDLVKTYPPIEPPDFAHGKINSASSPDLCLDLIMKRNEESVGVSSCSSSGRAQDFHLTWHKDIRPGKRTSCLDVSNPDNKAPVTLYACHGMGGNQLWRYDTKTQQLRHGGNYRCLQLDTQVMEVYVSSCINDLPSQKWVVEHVNTELNNKWSSEVELDPIR